MIFEFVKKENKRGLSKSQIEHTVHKIKEGSSSLAKLKKYLLRGVEYCI